MFRRLALPTALAALLALSACAANSDDGPLSTPQVTTTDASPGTGAQGTGEQGLTEQGAAAQSTEAGADSGATGGATDLDTMSTSASLNAGEPGLPAHSGASIDDVLRLGAVASWVDAPGSFAISLPASPDCFASAGTPVAVDGQVVVAFEPAVECVTGDGARTYTMAVPEGIDTGQTVEVAVEGLDLQFTLALPGQ